MGVGVNCSLDFESSAALDFEKSKSCLRLCNWTILVYVCTGWYIRELEGGVLYSFKGSF